MGGVARRYRDPARCRHGGLEFCHGEIVRGLQAWHAVQYCR